MAHHRIDASHIDDAFAVRNPAERFIGFRLAGETYAVPILQVQEVRPLGRITQVPAAPAFVRGMISVRGTVVPAVDLRLRFGLPPLDQREQAEAPVVMVVQTSLDEASRTAAVVVDALVAVHEFGEEAIQLPPKVDSKAAPGFVRGVVQLHDGLIMILNLEQLLHTPELERISANHA